MMLAFVKALSMTSVIVLVAVVSSLFVNVFPHLMTIIVLINLLDNNACTWMAVGIAIVTPGFTVMSWVISVIMLAIVFVVRTMVMLPVVTVMIAVMFMYPVVVARMI